MTTVTARFEYELHQFLSPEGVLQVELPEALDDECQLELYRWMVKTRIFDEKAVALQRTGQLGTYASSLGQEAYSVAVGMAMEARDCLAPYYRDHAAQLIRGVYMHEILQFWGGSERGSNYEQGPAQDFPDCIPIATQITHAAGAALAYKLRGETGVVVATCGDGATSRGDFYESLNFAGVHKLPLVVVVNNNNWAISVPLNLQTAAETIAQKAVAAQVQGLRVDGSDALAMYHHLRKAIDLARSGEGPVLLEAVTERLCDHTTADDASRYRSEEELAAAWEKCPIKRMRAYLESAGLWDEEREARWRKQVETELAVEVEAYLSAEPEPPEAIIDYLYAQLPYPLEAQRQLIQQRHHPEQEDVA